MSRIIYSMLLAGAALLTLGGCANNSGGVEGLTKDGTGAAPIKLFGQAAKQDALAKGPGEIRSARVTIDQVDLKKAIHRYRIIEKIKGGAQQIVGVDLNGDGTGEALVYFEGAEWCISTGCRLVVFRKTVNGFRKMSSVKRVHKPVRVSSASTSGWRDIIVQTGNPGIGKRMVALKFNGNYPPNATTVSEKLAALPAGSEVVFAATPVAVGAN